jgi:cell division protease FtsH
MNGKPPRLPKDWTPPTAGKPGGTPPPVNTDGATAVA